MSDQKKIEEDKKDLMFDFIESQIDQQISDGLIKDIPVLKFFKLIIDAKKSFEETIFLKKLLAFSYGYKSKSNFNVAEHQNEVNYSSENVIGEKILLVLNMAENYEKCKIIGFLYKNLINGKIDNDDFIKYCSMINRIFYKELKKLYIDPNVGIRFGTGDKEINEHLVFAGFKTWKLEQISLRSQETSNFNTGTIIKNIKIKYDMTRDGEKLIELISECR